MNIAKTCIFGGTLLAAGVANAEFDVDTNKAGFGVTSGADAYAYRFDVGGGFANDAANGPGSGNTDITASLTGDSGATTSASVLLNETILSASATKTDNAGFAFFDTITTFDVDSDVSVTVNWAADLSIGQRVFEILDLDAGISVFNYQTQADPSSGSTTLTLNDDTDYQFVALLRSFDGDGGASFSVVIPAPGSAAILGLAGIAAARRRR